MGIKGHNWFRAVVLNMRHLGETLRTNNLLNSGKLKTISVLTILSETCVTYYTRTCNDYPRNGSTLKRVETGGTLPGYAGGNDIVYSHR